MELREYLRVFRAHWLGIVSITVLGVIAAFGWTLLQPKVYSADASAIVQASVGAVDTGTEVSNAVSGNNLATGRVKTYAVVGVSRPVAERVIAQLGLQISAADLVRQVTVSNAVDTLTLKVTAGASTPEKARALAEAWVGSMSAEVNRIESGDANTKGAVYLTPIDSAVLPEAPSSPNTSLALALGGLVGLAIAIGYGLLRYTLDRRLRTVEQVERETGKAVVGTIPDESALTSENRLLPLDGGDVRLHDGADLHLFGESLRELRTNLQYMDVDNPPRVIVVTSPLPGDGKTTIATNLAVTLASNGQPVVLIDGDLRRPMVDAVFGLPRGAGLSDVLAGRATIADVAQRFGTEQLLVITAGKVPPNPSEMLGSARMRELLDSIAREAVVVIDAPPLIPVTDAAVLAHSADGAIIVSTVGSTTYDALNKALLNLERAGARALGVVLNRVPTRGRGSAYYGYRYQGKHYRQDAPDPTGPRETAPTR
ncbi:MULTISPECIES: polysaccharide biosynthesis tyrosine autokinase [unclassified Microbacterium]|uniref:polysaccharide biosynthesis tyrosine autokinase n=1 Tax=unclassified Microbacterium TaxID=2609290 RepID=UPI001AD4A2FD|nr:polysaccharide biosynthesis tyrosine autokinase [Microbacterium sp.]MBN9157325.1 polysaccharide biosynthesis tyrosine autokinase [Microbacterium sp.]MBS1896517.1 polysaccharide biosynthesis tyrosine autokinase [Actinomycetota bacterium]